MLENASLIKPQIIAEVAKFRSGLHPRGESCFACTITIKVRSECDQEKVSPANGNEKQNQTINFSVRTMERESFNAKGVIRMEELMGWALKEG